MAVTAVWKSIAILKKIIIKNFGPTTLEVKRLEIDFLVK